jgi:CxxC motif-containing protein (DUF1111 family)
MFMGINIIAGIMVKKQSTSRKKINSFVWVFMFLSCILGQTACKKIMPAIKPDDAILDGPLEALTPEQTRRHLNGDFAFNSKVFTPETGLGSVCVANRCGSCHAGDGKGHPFTSLIRFGQMDSSGNLFLDKGGPQLQNRAIPGYQPETLPAGASASVFMPPAITGLGYLELVSDADLLAMSDPDDLNSDGISGVPGWKTLAPYLNKNKNAVSKNGKYIHRFGKKSATYSLFHQTVNAYNQDMGITSIFEPKDAYSLKDIDPEISSSEINDVVFYLQTLKSPIQRDQNNAEVLEGKKIFSEIGCTSCHKETLTTEESPISALSKKEFHPYSDLLLHDMGSDLDDGYTEGSAATAEWRTAPLWGLGLSPNSQGGQFYLLHDGRARSIEQAILLHGGEGSSSKQKFQVLSETNKSALLKFLNSL